VVDALAVPLAIIVHAGQLNRELVAARVRASAATEAERSRLRHDLHDGLGPSLSGVGLGLEAVSTSLPADVGRAQQIVERLRIEVAYAVEEVRRIIDAVGPAVLEDGGLADALRKRVAVVCTSSTLEVDLQMPPALPHLPEDVVVAAYRIVDEALTNVMRHAAARQCLISIAAADSLVVEVRDDGPDGRPIVPAGSGWRRCANEPKRSGASFRHVAPMAATCA
jgi:two-component system, NarL family, sensor kinase